MFKSLFSKSKKLFILLLVIILLALYIAFAYQYKGSQNNNFEILSIKQIENIFGNQLTQLNAENEIVPIKCKSRLVCAYRHDGYIYFSLGLDIKTYNIYYDDSIKIQLGKELKVIIDKYPSDSSHVEFYYWRIKDNSEYSDFDIVITDYKYDFPFNFNPKRLQTKYETSEIVDL